MLLQTSPLEGPYYRSTLAPAPPPLPTVAQPPPLPAVAGLPAIEFYYIDSRKLGLREWLRSASVLTSIIGWIAGRLGISLTENQRAPVLRDWAEAEIFANQVPADVLQMFAGRISELQAVGFRGPYYCWVANRTSGYEDFAALFLAPSGRSFARIFLSRGLPGYKVRPRFDTSFITAMSDGRFLLTSDLPPRFDFAPNVLVRHQRGASTAALWRSHEEEVRRISGEVPDALANGSMSPWTLYTAFEQNDCAFQVARGLLAPPSAADAVADAKLAETARAGAQSGSPFGDAWTELERLQAHKRSGLNGLLLLIVSAIAFAGIGIGKASPQTLALIIGVLFIHELGHYFAMRFFKYRELRMFFLPMLGAAVSGKHYNVAGWKKALVSLLGPVPGIFAGAALGAYILVSGHHLLAPAALMLMGLNALNLLPIIPLDGGWFWNAVLFSRHRWLEAGFKIFAGGIGLLAAAVGFGWIGLLIGVTTLLSIPVTLTVGGVVGRLRRAGHQPAATDLDTVPRDTAEAIFTELDAAKKGKLNAKTLATLALQVFERLNARPPNWLETIGLSAVYFISIVVAIVGMSLLAFSKFGAGAGETPIEKTAPALEARYQGEFQHAPSTRPDERTGRHLLLAMFPSSEAAAAAYAQLATDKSEAVDLQQFGQSVLLSAPNRKNTRTPQAAETLRAAGARVFDNGNTAGWYGLNLAVTAPDLETAAQIQRAFDTWFRLPMDLRPTAPWLVDPKVDPAKQEAINRSCETYVKMEQTKEAALQEPGLLRRTNESLLVTLFTRREKAKQRYAKQIKARDQAQRAAVEKLLEANDPHLDPAVLAHELTRPALPVKDFADFERWQAAFRPLLTHEPAPAEDAATEFDDAGEPTSGVAREVYMSGNVQQSGGDIVFTKLGFASYTRDLPALTNYLLARGCSGVRYGIDAQSYRDPITAIPELEE